MPELTQRMWSSDPAATVQQRPEGHAQLTDTGQQGAATPHRCQNVQPARLIVWLLPSELALLAAPTLVGVWGNLDFVSGSSFEGPLASGADLRELTRQRTSTLLLTTRRHNGKQWQQVEGTPRESVRGAVIRTRSCPMRCAGAERCEPSALDTSHRCLDRPAPISQCLYDGGVQHDDQRDCAAEKRCAVGLHSAGVLPSLCRCPWVRKVLL